MSELFDRGHACVIGIGGDLPTTVNDATGIAKILTDPERCAYSRDRVRLLTGESATRSNIISALERLATTTDADSTVLVYFSGHGYQLTKPIKSYFLMPHGYNAEDLGETAISGSEFTELLQNIPAQKLMVIFDCCHAGGLSDLSGFQIAKAPLPPEAQKLFAKGGGRITIGSSRPDELSYAGTPYSAFTYALMKGLCGTGAAHADGYVRATDLAMYASETVPTMTGNKQHPVLDIDKADNFILSYYAAGQTQPKGLPSELATPPKIESKPGELNGNNINVVASGKGAVAIGGNAKGAVIISGDGNVVGDRNVTKKTEQHGKKDVNIDRAKGINVDDAIDPKAIDAPRQIDNAPARGIQVSAHTKVEVPVFFATDRAREHTESVKTFYGGERNSNGETEYGIATVSIPADHRMGEIERPKWWKLEFKEDPEKHVVLLNIDALDATAFTNNLRDSVATADAPDLLLFVHGYNTSFEDAALRTAQIAYDLNFPGPAIVYTWPSAAKLAFYPSDENNIDWTIPHFDKFLRLLLTEVGAAKVDAIAHSMGNRILIRAIDNLDYAALPQGAAKLSNAIFAAPDIDADTFKQFASNFHAKADRFTLYASSNDKALQASKLVHGGQHPRAGDSGKDLVIVDGLDTIDASLVDTSLLGHAYFGDNRSIISDIFYLLKQIPPNQRVGLQSRSIQASSYWLFQP